MALQKEGVIVFVRRYRGVAMRGLPCVCLLLGSFAFPADGGGEADALKAALREQRTEIKALVRTQLSDPADRASLERKIKDKIQETILRLDRASTEEERHLLSRHCRDLLFSLRDVRMESLRRSNPSFEPDQLIAASEYLIDTVEKVNAAAHSLSENDRLYILSPLASDLYRLHSNLARYGYEAEALRCTLFVRTVYEELIKAEATYSNESAFFTLTLSKIFLESDYETFLKEARELLVDYQDRDWALREASGFGNGYPRFEMLQKYGYSVMVADVYRDHPGEKSLANLYSDLASKANLLGLDMEAKRWRTELITRFPDHPRADIARQVLEIVSKKEPSIVDDLFLAKADPIPKANAGEVPESTRTPPSVSVEFQSDSTPSRDIASEPGSAKSRIGWYAALTALLLSIAAALGILALRKRKTL